LRKFLRRWKTLEGFTFRAFAFLSFKGHTLCTLAIEALVFTSESIKALTLEGVQMLLPVHPFEVMFALHPFPIAYTHSHSLPLHVLTIETVYVIPLHPLTLEEELALTFAFYYHPLPLIHRGRRYPRMHLGMDLRTTWRASLRRLVTPHLSLPLLPLSIRRYFLLTFPLPHPLPFSHKFTPLFPPHNTNSSTLSIPH
jgi:hypothetical protein